MNILLFSPLQIILDEEKYYIHIKGKNTIYTIEFYTTVNYFFLHPEYFEMVLHSIPKLLKPLQ